MSDRDSTRLEAWLLSWEEKSAVVLFSLPNIRGECLISPWYYDKWPLTDCGSRMPEVGGPDIGRLGCYEAGQRLTVVPEVLRLLPGWADVFRAG